MTHYSTVEAVLRYSGAMPEMLGLKTQYDLEQQVEQWLGEVTDFINADRNRDYRTEANVPAGIHNIAMRMVSNLIRSAQRQRTGSIVQVDGRDLVLDDAAVFSTQIKVDLRRYPAKPRLRIQAMPVYDE